jgi:phytoene synthase
MLRKAELAPPRALTALYTEAAQRRVLVLLCEVEAAVAESVRPGIEHQVGHARLEWWREECARCTRGVALHPATRALTGLFAARALAPPSTLSGFVDTATWDLASATCETRRDLAAYCSRWADAMLTPLLAYAAADAGAPLPGGVLHLGATLREIELLAHLAADARRGRLRLPLDELARAGIEPREAGTPPWRPALTSLLRARWLALRVELAARVAQLPRASQPPLRGLLVWTELAARRAGRCAHALPGAPGPRDHQRPLGAWWAWRAARRADRGDYGVGAARPQ